MSARCRIVILDACRNWPSEATDQASFNVDIDQLAAEERSWRNLLLAYSTSSSSTAGDGIDGLGSFFCQAFCRHMLDHTINIDECFRLIAQEVIEKSHLTQQPWTYSSLQRSVSFSDLPRFTPLLRHVLPHSGRAVASWCVPDSANQGVYAGLGEMQAWHVNLARRAQVRYSGSTKLIGAVDLGPHLILGGSAGEIFVGNGPNPAIKLPVEPSFGLVASPDRLGFTHFGDRTATVFQVTGANIKKLGRIHTNFGIYCCAYLDEDTIWLGGVNGKIVEVKLSDENLSQRPIAELRTHINAMILSPIAGSIFCACQSGLLAEVDKDGRTRAIFLERRRPKTPAGIREALINDVMNDLILYFIFNPSEVPQDTMNILMDKLGYSAIVSCAHAPSQPILAVGTDESTVIIFDTRDAQIIQEIEISTGHPGNVAGLVFLSDLELVAIGPEGQVIFLSGFDANAEKPQPFPQAHSLASCRIPAPDGLQPS